MSASAELFSRNIELPNAHSSFLLVECKADEFDCDDDTCIDASLYCNKRNNCKFLKDEVDCPVSPVYCWTYAHKVYILQYNSSSVHGHVRAIVQRPHASDRTTHNS